MTLMLIVRMCLIFVAAINYENTTNLRYKSWEWACNIETGIGMDLGMRSFFKCLRSKKISEFTYSSIMLCSPLCRPSHI